MATAVSPRQSLVRYIGQECKGAEDCNVNFTDLCVQQVVAVIWPDDLSPRLGVIESFSTIEDEEYVLVWSRKDAYTLVPARAVTGMFLKIFDAAMLASMSRVG